ncbi:hypothetical protein PFDSM3638_05215 [Pyrococcus furiosus DSM 3638]|uniref:Uncharacterized protein n=3 Tax=Pyrococcus furiosus TaxID=2261 RepID=A0A5C0XV76_PYRFU|nr:MULTISPECIES: hypothetical protein [Pyrococcus]AAL81162.1 hypothetical protein PF1038 [Pyrococcus furiosus DSM 3638]AFN03834.1 hypothetical protein PFC_04425 [Pyrococcus furiosus COM1]MDK2868837.1 hypothetical protein [Pyrococcus sp.]QEK78700.1 hypothetical protein PFDSM3638_05215 [Pyrococcus furiosus DSM 3638]
MKFKGSTFGRLVRIEFDILRLGELKIDDLSEFDTSEIKLEIKATSSGIKLVGVWEGDIEKVGEAIKKALEESIKLRERILRKMKSKVERIRKALLEMGFREEQFGYGEAVKFVKKVGDFEIAIIVSSREDIVRVEVYGEGNRKIIAPELEAFFESVDIEEIEVYDIEEEGREEKVVINLELPKSDEKPEKRITEAVKILENILMA